MPFLFLVAQYVLTFTINIALIGTFRHLVNSHRFFLLALTERSGGADR